MYRISKVLKGSGDTIYVVEKRNREPSRSKIKTYYRLEFFNSLEEAEFHIETILTTEKNNKIVSTEIVRVYE